MVQETLFPERHGDSQSKAVGFGFDVRFVFIRRSTFGFAVRFPGRRTGRRTRQVICHHPDQPRPVPPAAQPNLQPATVFGREIGGTMLGIKGTTRLWYVSSITNMGFGKYRLFSEVEALGHNPYNKIGFVSPEGDMKQRSGCTSLRQCGSYGERFRAVFGNRWHTEPYATFYRN